MERHVHSGSVERARRETQREREKERERERERVGRDSLKH
jgi:hypothetical protein